MTGNVDRDDAAARVHMRRCPDHEVVVDTQDSWRCLTCEDEENVVDAPRVDLCGCDGFEFWYAEEDFTYCVCGHGERNHIDEHGPCVGAVSVTQQ